MLPAQGLRADSAHLQFSPVRLAASLRKLDGVQRKRARRAADALIDCLHGFVRAGHAPLVAAIGDAQAPAVWQHYRPDTAALDARPGVLHYYYHAHPSPGASAEEHGHFHLFAQLGSDPAGVPTYTQLLAIGVDARGMPCRLFTTNRWVTDETWLPASQVLTLAEQVAATVATADEPVERWLRAQLGVFAPQVAQLLRHRDQRMAARQRGGRRPGLFEDRRMQVISQCRVSVASQLAALDQVVH